MIFLHTGIHCSTSERDIIDGDYKNSITIVTTTSESPVNPSFNIASPTDGSTGDSRTVTNTHDVDPTPSPKNTMDNKRGSYDYHQIYVTSMTLYIIPHAAAGNTSPQFDLVGGLIAAGTILIISVLLVLTLVILIVVRLVSLTECPCISSLYKIIQCHASIQETKAKEEESRSC